MPVRTVDDNVRSVDDQHRDQWLKELEAASIHDKHAAMALAWIEGLVEVDCPLGCFGEYSILELACQFLSAFEATPENIAANGTANFPFRQLLQLQQIPIYWWRVFNQSAFFKVTVVQVADIPSGLYVVDVSDRIVGTGIVL